jgi:DNA-binding NtrC family response regulator
MAKLLRALIVEDSENDALLIVRTLQKGGYDSLYYERVDTAPALRAALKKTWDIVLCDYVMPTFSAMDAIAVIKEIGVDIPVILVSGTIVEGLAVEAMQAGARDFFRKDRLERLVPAIERELIDAAARKKRAEADKLLKARNEELEVLNKSFVGRELKMIELKEEIDKLKKGSEPEK